MGSLPHGRVVHGSVSGSIGQAAVASRFEPMLSVDETSIHGCVKPEKRNFGDSSALSASSCMSTVAGHSGRAER